MGRPVLDLDGQRFGMWTVLRSDGTHTVGGKIRAKWICRCECGVERSVLATNLKRMTSGCGCEREKALVRRNTKHGLYGTPLYWRLESAKKKAAKLFATPPWADQERIKTIYRDCPDGHDVDHIVPLQSDLVCGLHCEANLQYLPSRENQSKKNRYWPDMTPGVA